MNRRSFIRAAASGLFIPAASHAQVSLASRRVSAPSTASSGEPASPLLDPDIWGFWRSDEQVSVDGGIVTCASDPFPNGWTETSPSARVLGVSSACGGPAYNASGAPNGKPAIEHSEITNRINTSGAVTIEQPYTVYVLWSISDLVAANHYLMDSQDGAGAKGALFASSGTAFNMYSGSVGPAMSPTLGSWIITTMIFDGASSSIQENNGTVNTGNPGTTGCTAFGFNGWGGNITGTRCVFSQAAVIVTSAHSDSAWLASNKAWLAWYGGLTI